ncbi:MAG: DUF937 domain-containing protein [Allorhizobium sp.]
MLPLFDMMMRAQNGNAMESIAGQFNLAQEQATKAMAALMPAFSSGLKRNATNPYDMSQLVNAMTSGAYAKYFEDVGKAFTPQGIADGNGVLERLFGSKEVSRAVAAQAEQMTGIGQDIFKQMLPGMASAIMGGLFKQSMGQMGEAANPFASGPMAAMMQQWLENSGMAPKKPEPPPATMFDNPFTQAMQGMFGAKAQPDAATPSNPFADNPFAKAFQEMMSGQFPATATPPKPAEPPTAEPSPANPYGEMMNAMFDSGLEVQKNYQKSMEQILEGYRMAPTEAPEPEPAAGKTKSKGRAANKTAE